MYPKWTFFQICGVFPIEKVSQKPRFKPFGMFGHARNKSTKSVISKRHRLFCCMSRGTSAPFDVQLIVQLFSPEMLDAESSIEAGTIKKCFRTVTRNPPPSQDKKELPHFEAALGDLEVIPLWRSCCCREAPLIPSSES